MCARARVCVCACVCVCVSNLIIASLSVLGGRSYNILNLPWNEETLNRKQADTGATVLLGFFSIAGGMKSANSLQIIINRIVMSAMSGVFHQQGALATKLDTRQMYDPAQEKSLHTISCRQILKKSQGDAIEVVAHRNHCT